METIKTNVEFFSYSPLTFVYDEWRKNTLSLGQSVSNLKLEK